jgi:hypothetical protein
MQTYLFSIVLATNYKVSYESLLQNKAQYVPITT